jgi:hypothetical protein
MDSFSTGADEQPHHRQPSQQRQGDLSKFASMLWRAMTKEQKEPFVQEALLEKQAHLIRHPDYVYRPSKRGSGRKTNVSVPGFSHRRQDEADTGVCSIVFLPMR